jgi:hypothetical protein
MGAAMGASGTVLAQPAQPAPDPGQPTQPTQPTGDAPPADQPAGNPANPPTPGPPPVAAQPPVTPPAPPPTTFPSMAGPALRLGDLFSIRPGVFLQLWGNFTQDAFKQTNGDAGAFSKNIYLRRARFFIAGGIGKDLTYFLLWESANVGQPVVNADGSINKQFLTFAFNDAFLDYKVNPNFSIQAGLMLLPFTRNILQSTSTYWSLDIGGVSASYIAATQTATLRDPGVQVKINALENHFELRGMVSEGVRLADTTLSSAGTPLPAATGRNPGKNDPRLTAFAQYNFLDPDTGYVFNGQYFGRKKIAGIAAGIDYQPLSSDNPYFATSLTGFAAIPLKGADPKNGGDEIGGQVEYLHFHGGRLLPAAGLLKQNDLLVELGYYNKNARLSLFGKFEGRFYDDAFKPSNQRIYGVGLKYFLAEQIANITLQYSLTQFPDLIAPTVDLRNDVNALQLQLQLGYF